MRHLKLACVCGATIHAADEIHELEWMALEWRAHHQGEGHGETDYMVAVQQREVRLMAEEERKVN